MIHWGPTFQDFIRAASQNKPGDALVLKNGRLEKKIPHEINEETLNRRTWSAFVRAVNREFTKQQRNHICARYDFEWDKMVNSTLPLERLYIEYFGVGAASPYSFTLNQKRGWFSNELHDQTSEQLYHLYRDATRSGYLSKLDDPSAVFGAPREGMDQLPQYYFGMDRQRCNLFRGISDLVSHDPNIPRMHPYYSRLSMGIISLLETKRGDEDEKLIIPAPGASEGALEFYEVYKVISFDGLTAVALVPLSSSSSLQPLLCFRCTMQSPTKPDAIPSMLNNMAEHIGEPGYRACAEQLNKLMEDPNFKRPTVLSYSQGGGYAGYFLEKHWRKVHQYVGFNSVGNDARVVENLADQINTAGENEIPPDFYIHRNISVEDGSLGDWVNKSGEKHIGWGIKHPNCRMQLYEWLIHDHSAPSEDLLEGFTAWGNIHARRPMDSFTEDDIGLGWKYQYKLYRGNALCDPILDTYKRDPKMENLRRNIGKQYLSILQMIYKNLSFLLRLFGIEIFKENFH
ncbi:MAG: hypothetical protein K1000chlam2_00702 [Chlamydiae bacterium]|nr:hypothetical protein [Chlamydiota bacterium]